MQWRVLGPRRSPFFWMAGYADLLFVMMGIAGQGSVAGDTVQTSRPVHGALILVSVHVQ